jgi:hypothetical protein
MNFVRHRDPKESLKIGKYANPKKARCLKNQYSDEYKKLRFTKKQIYDIDPTQAIGAWVVWDCFGQKRLFEDKTFREYFEIYS